VQSIKFIGVATAGSLALTAFPRWARTLGLDATIVGVDVPRDAPPELWRALLNEIRDDPECLGAVITSHKTAVYRNARDEFSSLDVLAEECREINSIRSRDGELHGYARDPVSVGRVADEIWPNLSGDLLCIGCGGTAIALARHLLERGQRGRLHFVDRAHDQARRFEETVADPRVTARYTPGPYDALVADSRPGTLIVNATGAGKDNEGSPVTDRVWFPPRTAFWELNYRGDLRMLAAARAQAADHGLSVHDGKSLFCHGWAAALAAITDIPDHPKLAARFSADLP
jgi:shikimate 5-dehydrogenase